MSEQPKDIDTEDLRKLKEQIDKWDDHMFDGWGETTVEFADEETEDVVVFKDENGRVRMWMPTEVYVDILKMNAEKNKEPNETSNDTTDTD